MNLQPAASSLHGVRRPCVRCKTMTPAEKLMVDIAGRAFMDYCCAFCVPQLTNCCDPIAHAKS